LTDLKNSKFIQLSNMKSWCQSTRGAQPINPILIIYCQLDCTPNLVISVKMLSLWSVLSYSLVNGDNNGGFLSLLLC